MLVQRDTWYLNKVEMKFFWEKVISGFGLNFPLIYDVNNFANIR